MNDDAHTHWSSSATSSRRQTTTPGTRNPTTPAKHVSQRHSSTSVRHNTIPTAGAGPFHPKWHELAQETVGQHDASHSPTREGVKTDALWPFGHVRLFCIELDECSLQLSSKCTWATKLFSQATDMKYKLKLFDAAVTPCFFYSSGNWTVMEDMQKKLLRTTEQRMLRILIQTKRNFKEGNAATHAANVDDDAEIRQRTRGGHDRGQFPRLQRAGRNQQLR